MGATLDALRDLQNVESQIADIRRQLAQKESFVAAQEKKLAQIQSEIKSERESLLAAQKDADRLDLDLKTKSAHVEKLREQLNGVRTNKEYAAVLSQLNTDRTDLSKIEAATLEKMDLVEKLKTAMAAREQAGHDQHARLENARKQLEEARRSFSERLNALTKDRGTVAARLDAKVRDLFNKVSERHEGEAMALLRRVHPRRDDFVCDGCNMSVTADRFNSLKTRDEVQCCSSCGRILYVETGG